MSPGRVVPLVVALLLLLLLSTPLAAAAQGGFGDPCESTGDCTPGLECTAGKCDCRSSSYEYETGTSACVLKLGAPCDSHDSSTSCVQNARCTSKQGMPHQCHCSYGYYDKEDGKCYRKGRHGEACTGDSSCLREETLRLVCGTEGRCECNSTLAVFDGSRNVCRRKAGASCYGYRYCVQNSECTDSVGSGEDSRVCICTSQYFADSDGTCVVKLGRGEKCGNDDHCGTGLKCAATGICDCDESVRVFDPAKGKCVGLANSPCQESTDDCVENAECSGDYSKAECRCREGYSNSSTGGCLASHSSRCGIHWTKACNPDQGLVCVDGTCKCKYEKFFQYFDEDLNKCVSKVHGPCTDSIPCVPNSHCATGGSGVHRTCQCDPGHVPVGYQCQLSFGQPCAYPDDETHWSHRVKCDEVANLQCIEGTCQCEALQVYDDLSMKCLGLVGSHCFVNKEDSDQHYCVNGAKCAKSRSLQSDWGACQCRSAWSPTHNRTCATGTTSPTTTLQSHT